MRRGFRLASLVLLLGFSSGCVFPLLFEIGKDPMGHRAALQRAQREYTNAIRWGDIDAAVTLVHPELQESFLDQEEAFEGIRVTDFDVGKVHYDDEETHATVRVTYRAYSMRSMLDKEIKETQQWERLGKANRWVLRPELEGLVEQVAELR
jgi:hypothetical protein